MSNPFPLTRPDGTVHAWACGCCGTVGCGGWHQGPDPVTGFCCAHPDDARADAERCCTCSTCRAHTEPGAPWCAACAEKSRAEKAAEKAHAVALPPAVPASPTADDVEAIYDVVMEGDVRLEVVIVDDHGVFYEGRCAYRDTENPENNRDFAEALQRNPMACLTGVLFSVAYYLNADVVSVTRRPQ